MSKNIKDEKNEKNEKRPGIIISLVPLLFLIFLLAVNIFVYKDSATAGPNQMILFLTFILVTIIGVFHLNVPYKKIEERVIHSIGLSMQANLILLVVGSLIGIWIMSGIVPTMIYYGLKLLHPAIFLPVSMLICCLVSLATGSSWSTAGTIGVAFMGIGTTLGLPPGMVAGSILSGAYFGDKMSPLSDTTNLAPAIAGTDLFTHVRHMMYTSVPAISLSLIIFTIMGFFYSTGADSSSEVASVLAVMERSFDIDLWPLTIPLVVFILVLKKMPALPAMIVGLLLGVIAIIVVQDEILARAYQGESSFVHIYREIMNTAYDGFKIKTGNSVVDDLFSRGGMKSMLNTIWLILVAMILGGALEATGMLKAISDTILKMVRSVTGLIGSTLLTAFIVNLTASDQYLAIVVTGKMFTGAFYQFGLHPKNLSRALEDSGTVTSCLVPWNTCGAYHSAVLGVATLTYAPFCFFNILSPLISFFLAIMGWTIEPLNQSLKKEAQV